MFITNMLTKKYNCMQSATNQILDKLIELYNQEQGTKTSGFFFAPINKKYAVLKNLFGLFTDRANNVWIITEDEKYFIKINLMKFIKDAKDKQTQDILSNSFQYFNVMGYIKSEVINPEVLNFLNFTHEQQKEYLIKNSDFAQIQELQINEKKE